MPPPEKENPAPALAAGNEAKSNRAKQKTGSRYSQPNKENQPIAIARNFGFVSAVFIREHGSERRAGLYYNIANAENEAQQLNRQFQIDAVAP